MRIFKSRAFNKWASKEGVSDIALLMAIDEMERGLIDADLGAHIFKKRVGLRAKGKSGGVRTLLAYQRGDKAFFVYGFAKNVRADISDTELKALKLYAAVLLNYATSELNKAVSSGALIEVGNDD